jgi:hypothetical protein
MKGGDRGSQAVGSNFLHTIPCQSTWVAQNIVTAKGKWSKRKAMSR